MTRLRGAPTHKVFAPQLSPCPLDQCRLLYQPRSVLFDDGFPVAVDTYPEWISETAWPTYVGCAGRIPAHDPGVEHLRLQWTSHPRPRSVAVISSPESSPA